MFPDSDNCFGRIKLAENLRILAVRLRLRDWHATVQQSPRDGERLYIESEAFRLRSGSNDGGECILEGVFDMDGKRGESAISKLSHELQELRIPHHFELYDESDSMCCEFKFEGH